MTNIDMDTKIVLLKKTFSNCTKEITLYCDNICDDDITYICIDYCNEYSNGEFQDGNAFVELTAILEAYSMKTYAELVSYYKEKYGNDENAWKKIILEIKEKGLDPSEDESEGEIYLSPLLYYETERIRI